MYVSPWYIHGCLAVIVVFFHFLVVSLLIFCPGMSWKSLHSISEGAISNNSQSPVFRTLPPGFCFVPVLWEGPYELTLQDAGTTTTTTTTTTIHFEMNLFCIQIIKKSASIFLTQPLFKG